MLDDLIALLDKPLVLLVLLTIGGIVGILIANLAARINRQKRRAYWRERNAGSGMG